MSNVLLEVISKAHERKVVPPSFSHKCTVLVPKRDEVEKLRKVTGFRPIILRNVSHKNFAKVLAWHFQGVVCDLMGEQQLVV